MSDNITLAQLEEFLRDYDAYKGSYPEHEFEGWCAFTFIRHKMKGGITREWTDEGAPEDWWTDEREQRVRSEPDAEGWMPIRYAPRDGSIVEVKRSAFRDTPAWTGRMRFIDNAWQGVDNSRRVAASDEYLLSWR